MDSLISSLAVCRHCNEMSSTVETIGGSFASLDGDIDLLTCIRDERCGELADVAILEFFIGLILYTVLWVDCIVCL